MTATLVGDWLILYDARDFQRVSRFGNSSYFQEVSSLQHMGRDSKLENFANLRTKHSYSVDPNYRRIPSENPSRDSYVEKYLR